MSATAQFRRGLVTIAATDIGDISNDADAYARPVHAAPDALYVHVRPDSLAGVTVLILENGSQPDEMQLIYSGRLSLPQGKLVVEDAEKAVRLVTPVASDNPLIELYCDDVDEPVVLIVRIVHG